MVGVIAAALLRPRPLRTSLDLAQPAARADDSTRYGTEPVAAPEPVATREPGRAAAGVSSVDEIGERVAAAR